MDKFTGLGVALVTPFKQNKEVDYDALKKLVEHQINGGTDYLVVQGTTGEYPTLSFNEKQEVLDFIVEVNNGKLPIVLGIGGNNTKAVMETYDAFNLNGVDAILSASPYYNKPTQEGIYLHYKELLNHFDLPVILYNVPGRTGSNMSSEVTVRLANDFDNAIGIKEASGDLNQVMHIIKDKPDDFLVISGDDALTLPMIAAGAKGLISVVANSHPQQASGLVKAALHGDFDTSKVYHYQILELIDLLFVDGSPGGVKETLKFLEICENHVRLPLVPVNQKVSAQIKGVVESLK